MMRRAILKPAPGLKVRDPITKQHLKEEGESKPLEGDAGIFWRRRIASGEVIEVQAEAPAKAAGKAAGKGE